MRSQENVAIVRECCEAFDRGDYAAALDALDPEVEYDLTLFPEGKVYWGHAGVQEAFRIWMGTWEDYRQECGELINLGDDEVLVPTREYGRGKGSDVALSRDTYALWKFRNRKAIRIRFYATEAEALEAAGLSAGI